MGGLTAKQRRLVSANTITSPMEKQINLFVCTVKESRCWERQFFHSTADVGWGGGAG